MSDQTLPPQPETIKNEELEAYVLTKLKTMTCNGCGERDFDNLVIDETADPILAARLTIPVGGPLFGSHLPAVAVICKNCGNVNLFYWPLVYEWVNSRREGLGEINDG